jgi:geranylgeranyl reductase family protein
MAADIAVIGGGPAGSWAAYLLARQGARVTVFDPSHPREKPCGGGVTGRALALIAAALDVDRIPAVRIRSARFIDSAAERSATVALRSDDAGHALLVASRACFDGQLLQAARTAGAAFENVRVIDVKRAASGFTLATADRRVHTASFIIGADGANSLVRRRLGTVFRRDQLSIATGYFAYGITSDEIVIELLADPPGYIWSFPRPDHLAVGICAPADAGVASSALRARTAEWMRVTGIGANGDCQPYAWPIPSLSAADCEAIRIAGDGWCLVGDAAGLADPITREGIFFALQSAQFAADALVAGRARRDRRFTECVRVEILAELARAARLKDGFFRPRFTRLMIDALHQSDGIRAVMADLIAGTQGYRDLSWRLIKTMEFGIACKALTASL